MQKQRLQKLKELNSPKNEEEEQALKFFAIGRARFQRIQGRQQKQVAAQMQEQQAALERQQQELQQLQQLYQQHHQQQQQQWQ
jgi:RIO-like serine/threonine protein kinase